MGNSKGVFEHSGVFVKIFILVAITLFFTLLLSPVVGLINFSYPSDIGWLKMSQLILSIGVFVLPPFVLAYLISLNPFTFLHFTKKKINWIDIIFVVLFMIIIIPFINLLGDLNHQLVLPKMFSGLEAWMKISEEQATQLTERLLQVHNIHGLFLNILTIAVLPAIGEELYFRGALQGVIQQGRGAKNAIWITAIIFSTIHFQFYGFVPRMLMGAFFGYLLFWSQNMWLPIAAHFMNNIIAVVFYYFQYNGLKLPDIDAIGTGNTFWIGLASGALGLFGFFWFKKRFKIQKTEDI